MKNEKLVLTKENVTITNYDFLEKRFGGYEKLKGILDVIKMLCEDSKRTKQIKSFALPEMSLTVVLFYVPNVKESLIELIYLPKANELTKNVLSMLITANPYNLHYSILQLASNYKCSTLTYNYTVAYNKERGNYEIDDIDIKGILE